MFDSGARLLPCVLYHKNHYGKTHTVNTVFVSWGHSVQATDFLGCSPGVHAVRARSRADKGKALPAGILFFSLILVVWRGREDPVFSLFSKTFIEV